MSLYHLDCSQPVLAPRLSPHWELTVRECPVGMGSCYSWPCKPILPRTTRLECRESICEWQVLDMLSECFNRCCFMFSYSQYKPVRNWDQRIQAATEQWNSIQLLCLACLTKKLSPVLACKILSQDFSFSGYLMSRTRDNFTQLWFVVSIGFAIPLA